jgi:hypothetical protein
LTGRADQRAGVSQRGSPRLAERVSPFLNDEPLDEVFHGLPGFEPSFTSECAGVELCSGLTETNLVLCFRWPSGKEENHGGVRSSADDAAAA